MKLSDATSEFLSYLKEELHYSPHTVIHYAIDLKQFSAFLEKAGLKNCSVSTIQSKDIRNTLFDLEKLKPSSRSRKLSAIRSFFDFCFRRGIIPSNPSKWVSHPKKPKHLPKPVKMEHVFSFLSKEPDWQNFKTSRNFMIFAMLFGCGLRISELCGLKLSNLSEDMNWIRVLGKGNKERDLPLPQRLKKHIRNYLKIRKTYTVSHPFIFPGPHQKSMSSRAIQRIIAQIASLSAEQHERFSPHQLRHSFASHLLTSGANLKGIQELLGHQHLTSTEIYTHIHTERLIEVMDKFHPTSKKKK
jgi:integrase/recombinase XerC